MGAILARLRAELRSGWRAWVSLALMLGVSAGAAVAAAAGARRTATAYPRFVETQDAFDALTGGGDERDYPARLARLAAMPGVRDAIRLPIVGGELTIHVGDEEELRLTFPEVLLHGDPSSRVHRATHRAKVLSGRLADPRVPDEVSVPFSFANRYGVGPGDTVLAGLGLDPRTFDPFRRERLRVVGIHAAPGDFEATGQTTFTSVFVTPALLERYPEIVPPLIPDLWTVAVHLDGGAADAYAFKERVEEELDIDVPIIDAVVRTGVQKTMRLYEVGLWVLAVLIALAAFAVVGQTLARHLQIEAGEYPSLRALGFSRASLIALGSLRSLFVAAAAVPIALAVAFLASPLTPIGAARVAEPAPGFAFDAAALGVGAIAVLIVPVVLSVMPAIRAARAAAASPGRRAWGSAQPSRVVSVVARTFAAPSAVTGLRMALERGRGRSAVPVRSTVLAVAIGVAAITATLVVGRSLTNLIDDPALAGFTYDAILPSEGEDDEQRERRIRAFPFVERTAIGTGLNIKVGGIDSFLVSFRHGAPIGFAVIEGRAPTDGLGADGLPEIALGPATMRRLGIRIGDRVTFAYPKHAPGSREDVLVEARARVVGRAAIPALPWMATEPGEGAVMSIGGVTRLSDDSGGCCFVRFREGTDLVKARAALENAGFQTFLRTKRADLATLEGVTVLPLALSLIFGLMAFAALAHVLVTGIRRRRRDLAILKTIGFVRPQVRGAVAWQASAIAAVCIVVGIPMGVVLGRWGWIAVADQFGVVPVPVVPLALLAALPLAILAANVIALLPARAAARTEPAAVLRTE